LFADACALIAFHGAGARGLTSAGVAAMRSGDVAVSAITIWEVSRKARIGKLPQLPPPVVVNLTGFLRRTGYRLVPLAPEVAEAANGLPPHHADPMDRMLIATALAEGATIITNDRIFGAYGVQVTW
jgi:PIN domain nuclease of toxin-antitoxin system